MNSQQSSPSQDQKTSSVLTATDALLEEIDQILDENTVEAIEENLKDFDPMVEKPYTLADAMREGASLTPQAFNTYTTAKGETCALSAAWTGLKVKGLV